MYFMEELINMALHQVQICKEIEDYKLLSEKFNGKHYKVNQLIFKGSAAVLPAKNRVSIEFSRFLSSMECNSALDLGCGSGILAMSLAQRTKKVTGTDINSHAIQNAKENARLNDIHHIEYLVGNAFEPIINERFDLIVCNPPFYQKCEFLKGLDMLCFSEENFLLHVLITEMDKYLDPGGLAIFVTSSLTDNIMVEKLLNLNKRIYKNDILHKGRRNSQDIFIWKVRCE
jgi:methylase of polypeptide subunit release factors